MTEHAEHLESLGRSADERSTPRPRRLDEATAARIALEGRPIERARLAYDALRDLLDDPEDTTRVFVLGLLVSRRSYPQFLARLTMDDRGARLLRERPSIDSRHVDFARLRALPATTLGGAYARYLEERSLDPDLFQAPPGLPEVPAYVSQRMRQVHDLWHVLTGYDTDVRGEVALQAFTYGQTGTPSALIITVGALLRFGMRDRTMLPLAVDGFRRGRDAVFLPPLWLEEMWDRPLEDVRRELGIVPAREALH
jgi:ubiquinone biosynthesis protein COQ4